METIFVFKVSKVNLHRILYDYERENYVQSQRHVFKTRF